jgi:hypothetical protein
MMVACNVSPKEEPEPEPNTKVKKEQLLGKWKLTAGKVTEPANVVPNIYDRNNTLLNNSIFCTENSIFDFKDATTFEETSNCYTPPQANPQAGTYTFSESEQKMTITYNNTAQNLVNRTLVIKAFQNGAMILEFKGLISGVNATIEFTYNKQP